MSNCVSCSSDCMNYKKTYLLVVVTCVVIRSKLLFSVLLQRSVFFLYSVLFGIKHMTSTLYSLIMEMEKTVFGIDFKCSKAKN